MWVIFVTGMKKLRSIQFRVTKDEFEKIKNNAMIKGFCSTSGYVRYCALDQEMIIAQKIHEMHSHLLGDVKKEKFKKNPALKSRPSFS